MRKSFAIDLCGGLLAVSIFLGGQADALASGKYTKKEEAIPSPETSFSQPGRRAAAQAPAMTASELFLKTSAQSEATLDKQIKLLEELGKLTSDSDAEKPDLLFRLAQLYEERARSYGFRARALDEEIFKAKASLTEL